MRVRRELELASNKPSVLLNDKMNINPKAIVDNFGISGQYLNSNGLNTYPEVWGKRAKWMQLSGKVANENVSICIFDHKSNLNHPPHWMARDYGLFGVNSFGSNIYTKGKEQFNFTLKKEQSVTFKYQVVILNDSISTPYDIEKMYEDFINNY